MAKVMEVEVVELETIPCAHCQGTGECSCLACLRASSASQQMLCGEFRDEFDTGRQNEGTCRECCGLGKTEPDGQPLAGVVIEF